MSWIYPTSHGDVARVGGKNASLGELFRVLKPKGVGVLDGFATTADTYRRLLEANCLERRLRSIFTSFDPENLAQLAERGKAARRVKKASP
jgi:pyruvate, water dikinase